MKAIPEVVPGRRLRDLTLVSIASMGAGIMIGFALHASYQKEQTSSIQTQTRVEPGEKPDRPQARKHGGVALIAQLSALEQLRALTTSRAEVDFTEAALLIRQLEASDCRKALQLLQRVPGDERRGLLNALAARWADVDAAGAFAAAQAERHDNDWRNRLGSAASAALAASDPKGALDRIAAAQTKELREKIAEWVLPAVAKANPALAAEYLNAHPFQKRYSDIYWQVAREYGRTSPRAAIAWANSLAQAEREKVARGAWVGWAETNPAEAAGGLEAAGVKVHPDVYQMLGNAWSRQDPFAALAWAQSIKDETSRANALRSLELNPEKLGKEGVLKFLTSISEEKQRSSYANQIAAQMARQDVSAALAFAESLPEEKLKFNALTPVISEWSASDPAAAARYATVLPEGKQAGELLGNIVQNWCQIDSAAALAYARELPAGLKHDHAAAAAINSMREEHPVKALELFQTVEDPKLRGTLGKDLAAALVRTDPQSAFSLVQQISSEAQPEAYRNLIRNYAVDHPQEAADWINKMEPGRGRDGAVKAYVSVIDGKDPALATEWARRIDDPIERVDALFGAFGRWSKEDKPAASAWLEKAKIEEGFRPFFDRLLKDGSFFD